MFTHEYSISELSDLTGIPVRTIRSYIQQGLIPRPRSLGRGATYSSTALDRLFAIKAYREVDGNSFEEIRAKFLTLSQNEIAEKADPYRRSTNAGAVVGNTSALDYLTQLRNAMGGEWTGETTSSISPQSPTGSASVPEASATETPIDRALSRMAALASRGSTRRSTKADPWITLAVNQDIELRIRGAAVGADLGKYELLVDYIREALFGEDNR